MSNFTPLVSKEYEFDGDKVVVSFTRLRRKDMLKVLPAFKKIQDSNQVEGEPMTEGFAEGINDILNDVAELIPNYVKEFTGLYDTDSTPITIETVVNELYFAKLSGMIVTDLIKESGVSGEV